MGERGHLAPGAGSEVGEDLLVGDDGGRCSDCDVAVDCACWLLDLAGRTNDVVVVRLETEVRRILGLHDEVHDVVGRGLDGIVIALEGACSAHARDEMAEVDWRESLTMPMPGYSWCQESPFSSNDMQ